MTTVYNDDACIRSLGSSAGGGSSEPPVVLTYTDTHQLVLADLDVSGNVVEMASSDAIEVIVPLDATLLFTPANQAMFIAGGIGDVTFVGETPDVVINSKEGMLTLNGQYAGARLYKRNEPNQWGLVGDLKSGVRSFRMLAPDASGSSFTVAVEMVSGDAIIDWGDGSEPTVTSGGVYSLPTISNPVSHDYSGYVGAAEIKVTGDVKRIQINGTGITEVLEYASYQHYMFNLPDLVVVPSVIPSSVVDASIMFYGCTSFNQPITIPDSVTSCFYTLLGCISFNSEFIIGNSVTDTTAMLAGCSSFNQPITIPDSVTNILGMLQECTTFNQIVVIPDSVTNASQLLANCVDFNSMITIGSSVASCNRMLYGCSAFNQPIVIPDSVTNTDLMLFECVNFDQSIALSSGIISANEMFGGCSLLNSPITLTTPNVMNMNNMLKNATIFNQDLSGWCVTNIASEPLNFAVGSSLTEPNKPVWGTCPV